MGCDDEVDVDTDDLNDHIIQHDHDETTRRHRSEDHSEPVRHMTSSSSSSSVEANMLLNQQRQHQQEQQQQQQLQLHQQQYQEQQQQHDDEIAAVVNRQLSASFGDGPDYDDHSSNMERLPPHFLQDSSGMEIVASLIHNTINGNNSNNSNNIDNIHHLHQHQHQQQQQVPDGIGHEPIDDLSTLPRICRICHKMDDRPVLRFAPVPFPFGEMMAVAPQVQTFPMDICVHVFCGKTASILPNVNQPEYEILTKAGIKNKHGIGGEVNAALSRTRCAILPTDVGNGKEKQFYLIREFEAHLAAVRGYMQSNQQIQPLHHGYHHQHHTQVSHRNHFNPSFSSTVAIPHLPSPPVAAPLAQVAAGNGVNGGTTTGSGTLDSSSLNNSYLQHPQPLAAISSSSTASNIMAALSTPSSSTSSHSNNHQYTSQLLQRLNNNVTATSTTGAVNHHAIRNSSNDCAVTLNLINGTITGTPSGPSSIQHPITQQQIQQPTNLSNLILNSGNSLDQLYSNTFGSSNDILNLNQNSSNNTDSPTLDQLESIYQQQQQIQQQQSSTVASTLLESHSNYSTTSSTGSTKTIPAKAGNTNSKYQSPVTIRNTVVGHDYTVHCDCGGKHLSTHTTKGQASYKTHLSTKRHQKYLADQEQMRLNQNMSTENNNGTNHTSVNSITNISTINNNGILQYTASGTPPIVYNSNILLGPNQFNSFIDTNNSIINNSHNNSDNNNGGNSSSNSSVYGAAV